MSIVNFLKLFFCFRFKSIVFFRLRSNDNLDLRNEDYKGYGNSWVILSVFWFGRMVVEELSGNLEGILFLFLSRRRLLVL